MDLITAQPHTVALRTLKHGLSLRTAPKDTAETLRDAARRLSLRILTLVSQLQPSVLGQLPFADTSPW